MIIFKDVSRLSLLVLGFFVAEFEVLMNELDDILLIFVENIYVVVHVEEVRGNLII